MRIVYEYSHLGGSEILQLRYPDCERDIYEIIASVSAERSKISREKTMRGRKLYSPKNMNQQFSKAFENRGYHEVRDTYTITIPNSDIAILGAFKQIDFVKGKVLVEVQFGKYAFMFYDMAKFQYFFNENKADVGIEIVPCHDLKKHMSTGVSYGEQLVYDIERLKRHF
ncbi:MAG: BstYI, partial [Chloroflexi bacterium RBG_13_56_8]